MTVTNLDQFTDDLAVRVITESLVRLVNYQTLDGFGRANASTEVVGDDLRSQIEHTLVSPSTTPIHRLHGSYVHTYIDIH